MREVSLKNKLKNQKLGVKVFSYTFTSVSNIQFTLSLVRQNIRTEKTCLLKNETNKIIRVTDSLEHNSKLSHVTKWICFLCP